MIINLQEMKKLKELDQLEQELTQMLDNIKRVRDFVREDEQKKWRSQSSAVFGELKHRGIVLKSTITRLGKLSTSHLTY